MKVKGQLGTINTRLARENYCALDNHSAAENRLRIFPRVKAQGQYYSALGNKHTHAPRTTKNYPVYTSRGGTASTGLRGRRERKTAEVGPCRTYIGRGRGRQPRATTTRAHTSSDFAIILYPRRRAQGERNLGTRPRIAIHIPDAWSQASSFCSCLRQWRGARRRAAGGSSA